MLARPITTTSCLEFDGAFTPGLSLQHFAPCFSGKINLGHGGVTSFAFAPPSGFLPVAAYLDPATRIPLSAPLYGHWDPLLQKLSNSFYPTSPSSIFLWPTEPHQPLPSQQGRQGVVLPLIVESATGAAPEPEGDDEGNSLFSPPPPLKNCIVASLVPVGGSHHAMICDFAAVEDRYRRTKGSVVKPSLPPSTAQGQAAAEGGEEGMPPGQGAFPLPCLMSERGRVTAMVQTTLLQVPPAAIFTPDAQHGHDEGIVVEELPSPLRNLQAPPAVSSSSGGLSEGLRPTFAAVAPLPSPRAWMPTPRLHRTPLDIPLHYEVTVLRRGFGAVGWALPGFSVSWSERTVVGDQQGLWNVGYLGAGTCEGKELDLEEYDPSRVALADSTVKALPSATPLVLVCGHRVQMKYEGADEAAGAPPPWFAGDTVGSAFDPDKNRVHFYVVPTKGRPWHVCVDIPASQDFSMLQASWRWLDEDESMQSLGKATEGPRHLSSIALPPGAGIEAPPSASQKKEWYSYPAPVVTVSPAAAMELNIGCSRLKHGDKYVGNSVAWAASSGLLSQY